MSEAPTRVRRPAAPPPGEERQRDEVLLGRYRVLARRGTGGFGTVCTCWDSRLQRRVAIKRMPIMAQSGTTEDEALSEARTACMLGHPNIVTVFDFEVEGAYAYLVMEYVDGLNLAELLARVEGGRLTPEECAHVVSSVGAALAFAHENRVLHLDIKPTNIMVDRQGTVKLADFGMATLSSAAGYGDARGGTVGYMPIEQIEGGLVDERTDVFSLAVVAWQALTGTNPFAARSAEDSIKRISRGPGRLSRLCPGLDQRVEGVLRAQLDPSPAGRSARVSDFAAELAALLGGGQAGAASLRELVGQTEDDDGGGAPARPGGAAPRLLRVPEGIVARAATVLAAFSTLRLVLPALPMIPRDMVPVASVAAAAALGVWLPLAAPVVSLTLAAALVVTSGAPSGDVASPASLVSAALLVAMTLAWWVRAGARERLSSLVVLLPCCLPSPVAGAALAGYALGAAPAAAGALLGYLTGTLFHLVVASGFSPAAMDAGIAATAADPSFWALLVGSVALAAVAGALAERGSVFSGVLGQLLGLTCLVGCDVLAAWMENASIWGSLDVGTLVLAVLLSVLLCIATVLRGPLYEDQEGMGPHEFYE